MSNKFDGYQIWFGIPADQQPPDHYRLLGLKRFESDFETIDQAVNRRVQFLQDVAGERPSESQAILNRVAEARLCLTDLDAKKLYDTRLKMGGREPKPHTPATEPSNPRRQSEPNRVKANVKPKPQTGPRKNNSLIGLAIVVAVLVVVGVGLGAMALSGSPAENSGKDNDVVAAAPAVQNKDSEANQKKTKDNPNKKQTKPNKQGKGKENSSKPDGKSNSKENAKPTKNSSTGKNASGKHAEAKSKPNSKTGGNKKLDQKTSVTQGGKTGNAKRQKPADDPVGDHAPKLIPHQGLVVWLNANDSRLKPGPIDEWPNHLLAQPISAKMPDDSQRPVPGNGKPAVVLNSINGLPAVRFDGRDEKGSFLVLGDLSPKFDKNSATVFCLVRPEDERYSVYVTAPLDGGFRHATQSRVSMFAKESRFLFGDFPNSDLYCFTVECQSDAQTVWINGEKKVHKTGIEFAPGTFHRVGSPANFDTSNSKWQSYWRRQFFKGDIAEILVYDRKLSAFDRQRVENYLYHKWKAGKQYGPPPTVELYNWVTLKPGKPVAKSVDGNASSTTLKRSKGGFIQVNDRQRGNEEWLEVRVPLKWDNLTGAKLTIPADTEIKGRRSMSIQKLEARLVPTGLPFEKGSEIGFARVDSVIENLEFALDTKPRPWVIPIRPHPTEAVFVFDKALGPGNEKQDLVIRMRQKDISSFRWQVTARSDWDGLIKYARKTSGADTTVYAPDVFGVNFGGEAFDDGAIKWQKAVPFDEKKNPIGYIGGSKRDFEGAYWRTCHEGIREFRAVVRDGRYNVRLVFADPTPAAPGNRDFAFSIEGIGIPSFDIKSIVKKKLNRTIIPVETEDKKVKVTATVVNDQYFYIDISNLEVTDRRLDVVFSKGVGETVISALAVQKSARR